MNLLLWAGQIILAIKLITVTVTHGMRPEAAKRERGEARFGALARPLLIAIALVALLTALSLVLPPALGLSGALVAWTAALVAVFMLAGVAFHLGCRENPKPFVGIILALIAALVSYGRFIIAPF